MSQKSSFTQPSRFVPQALTTSTPSCGYKNGDGREHGEHELKNCRD
jgi:hypothetical protein